MDHFNLHMKGANLQGYKMIHPNNPTSSFALGRDAFGGDNFQYNLNPTHQGGRSANDWVRDNSDILDRAGDIFCMIQPERCGIGGGADEPIIIERETAPNYTVLYIIAAVITILLLVLILRK